MRDDSDLVHLGIVFSDLILGNIRPLNPDPVAPLITFYPNENRLST
jgi:hypothetical protein